MLYNLNLIESYLVHGNNINLIDSSIGFNIVRAGDFIPTLRNLKLHLNFGLDCENLFNQVQIRGFGSCKAFEIIHINLFGCKHCLDCDLGNSILIAPSVESFSMKTYDKNFRF